MDEKKTISCFDNLNSVDVSKHVDSKEIAKGKSLKYLSWAWAWTEVKKRYPNVTYTIERFENGLPYVYDPLTGYMVFTTVTLEGVTHEMWLPVLDSANRTMFDHRTEYATNYGKKYVEAATMFDINKAIMRCLTKNLSMHGLGLYLYAGEDLPDDCPDGDTAPHEAKKKPLEPAKKAAVEVAPLSSSNEIDAEAEKKKADLLDEAKKVGLDIPKFAVWRKKNPEDLTDSDLRLGIDMVNKAKALKGKE